MKLEMVDIQELLDEMKGTINDLEETELKSLLFQFYLRMQLVEERKGYSEQQFFLDIKKTYHNLLEYKKNQASVEQQQFHTTHIVFGDSPTGSLKIALKELGLQQQEKIIPFSDLFIKNMPSDGNTPEGIM